ncbi:Pycsar system effector family protein [Psychrobacillus sp. FSL K6-2843]|uniref:Pycsar system effector family protein n=1 Tax=Psychrobacillus sp. FSL K6-2843 TaxID=2921549 RepID=UPI00315A8A49
MAFNDEQKQMYDYHKHNITYISDYIKFADTKAGVALSLNLLMIGFLGKASKEIGFNYLSITDVGMYLSLIFLLTSAYFFIFRILWPRYSQNTDFYMSWGGIGSFSNQNDYLIRLGSKSEDEFLEDMAIQNYDLSKVAVAKYSNLKLGFTFLSIGTLIGLFSWFFA